MVERRTTNHPRGSDENRNYNSSFSERCKASSDDVINLLANMHENRRARQVNEWDDLQFRALRANKIQQT
jgi:hypothetical protein